MAWGVGRRGQQGESRVEGKENKKAPSAVLHFQLYFVCRSERPQETERRDEEHRGLEQRGEEGNKNPGISLGLLFFRSGRV